MSDICYSEVICQERDKREFDWLGYRVYEQLSGGCVRMIDNEADRGYSKELKELGAKGVIFYGHSAAGNDYPPVVFASDGAEYAVCETIVAGGLPGMELAEDGTIRGREAAEQYWRVLKSARAKLGVGPGRNAGEAS